MLLNRLACGFPSPADDYAEKMPSLDELLIKHPAATYLAKASGDSMIEKGILDGSLLIIDRSIEVIDQQTIVAQVQTRKSLKRMKVLDSINQRFGSNTLFIASQGFDQQWAMLRAMKSPSYTTNIQDIPVVKLG